MWRKPHCHMFPDETSTPTRCSKYSPSTRCTSHPLNSLGKKLSWQNETELQQSSRFQTLSVYHLDSRRTNGYKWSELCSFCLEHGVLVRTCRRFAMRIIITYTKLTIDLHPEGVDGGVATSKGWPGNGPDHCSPVPRSVMAGCWPWRDMARIRRSYLQNVQSCQSLKMDFSKISMFHHVSSFSPYLSISLR